MLILPFKHALHENEQKAYLKLTSKFMSIFFSDPYSKLLNPWVDHTPLSPNPFFKEQPDPISYKIAYMQIAYNCLLAKNQMYRMKAIKVLKIRHYLQFLIDLNQEMLSLLEKHHLNKDNLDAFIAAKV